MSRASRKVASPRVVCVEDLRPLARRRVPQAVFDYLDGGAEGEVTLRENCRAFEDVTFRPRHAVAFLQCDLRTRVLGFELALPFLLAPVGYSRLMHPGGEVAAAREAGKAGTAYIRDYSVPLVDAARRDPDAVRTVAATDEGRRRVDAIRAEFDGFVTTERGLAATRQRRSDAAARRAIVAAAGGLAGSIILVVLFAGYLTGAIVQPVHRAADMAGRLAAGDLGVLERSFNTMASSLEESREELAASRARIVAAGDQARRRIGLTDRVEALGGRISIASPSGQGTTMLVELPVKGG